MSGVRFLEESVTADLVLTEVQLAELARLSTKMVGTLPWWGEAEDGDLIAPRRIIQITPRGSMRYSVTVRNAIGAIGLPGMTMIIRPKIPDDHFAYLAASALGVVPRRDEAPVDLASGGTFVDLVMMWFVDALTGVVKRGLTRGYQGLRANRPSVRGSLHIRPTVAMWLKGRASIDCSFDVFDINTAENRILVAACRVVAGSALVGEHVRRRARRLLELVPGVGPIQPGDLSVPPTRSPHYAAAMSLARQVLGASGRSLSDSGLESRTFLIYTPDLVEQGIRRILSDGLAPTRIEKKRKVLVPSTVSVNPDILADPPPFTADVKYKIGGLYWNRPDLAQAVFFASAFGAVKAATISFRSESSAVLAPVQVGRVLVTPLLWDTRIGTSPARAAAELVSSFGFIFDHQSDNLVGRASIVPSQ
ncbi:MAG: hypothetical protein ABWX92_10250 [Mycetocola sp.]